MHFFISLYSGKKIYLLGVQTNLLHELTQSEELRHDITR